MRKLSKLTLISLLLASMCTQYVSAKDVIVPGFENQDYFTQLLRHTLSYSPDKNYKIVFFNFELPKNRAFDLITDNDGLDIIAAGATIERMQRMHAVNIPLVKGLFGWRVPLVAQGNHKLFENVNSLNQFKRLIPGQLRLWSDTKVLSANGIRVERGSDYQGLFKMLSKKRFDYFPRSVLEVYKELQDNKSLKLEIASNVMLRYPTAYLFYVNKQNNKLASDVHKGLLLAISDGSFEKLFNEFYGESINKIASENRKTFLLRNPFLPKGLPIDNPKYWVSLSNNMISEE